MLSVADSHDKLTLSVVTLVTFKFKGTAGGLLLASFVLAVTALLATDTFPA